MTDLVAAKLVGQAAAEIDVISGLVAVQGNDVQGAVNAAVARGASSIILPGGRTATISATVILPDQISEVVIDGALICSADVPIFKRSGTVSANPATNITAAIAAGARTVTAAPVDIEQGAWYFVVSADTLPGTTDKLGYMRQIRSFTATTVTYDAAIPRAMPSSTRRMRRIFMAPQITIRGSGSVKYSDYASKTASMMEFTFCNGVYISDLLLADGGGRCISLSHTVNWRIVCRIDNFVDDIANNHVGYGVDATGGTRNGYVGSTISRCRHSFTTNVGPNLTEFAFYGEPENITVQPVTNQCSDKALDTHRAGWGIKLIVNDSGSGGGVQVRADNVYVEGIISGSFVGNALLVQPNLVVPPTIGPLKISSCSADGIQLNGPAKFTAFPDFYNVAGAAIILAEGVKAEYPADPPLTAYLSSDATVTNSAALVDVAGLSIPMEANAAYIIEGFIVYSASQAADLQVAWSTPSGASFGWVPEGLSTGTTSTGGSVVKQYRAENDAANLGGVAAGATSKVVATPKGRITTTSAGNITFRFAQFVATADNAVVYAGSYLTARRIR